MESSRQQCTGKRSAFGRSALRIAGVAVLAAALACLLEAGTLYGAPRLDPLDFSQWQPVRMGVFFAMMLPLAALAVLFDWRAWARRMRKRMNDGGATRVRRALCWTAAAFAAGTLAAVAAGAACAGVARTQVWPYQLFFALVAVVVVAAIALRRSLAERPERLMLVVLLAGGVLMTFAAPPYTHVSWDDHIHFDRAVAASYLVNPEYSSADTALVGRHYNDVADFSRMSDPEQSVRPYEADRLDDVRHELDEAAHDRAGVIATDGPTTLRGVSILEYYLVAYVPAAVALWISRLVGMPFVTAFLLGRLANMATYAFVAYFACRRLKSGKLVLAVCACIPTALFLASSYSYDFWLTCFLMLGFAYFIGELQRPDEPLTWKHLVVMVGSFLVGLGPKAVYVPIAAMLLFMPRAKFAHRVPRAERGESEGAACAPATADAPVPVRGPALTHGVYLAIIFASAALVLASFVLPMFLDTSYAGDARGGEVNPSEQIAFILSEPFAYLEIFKTFLIWYVAPEQAYAALVDMCGIETAYTARYLLMALIPLAAVLDRAPCDAALATHAKRLAMLVLTLLTIFLMATSLYISFTPPRWDIIAGMQGRYLIPLLFPALALCLPFKPLIRLTTKIDRRVLNGAFLALTAFALFFAIFEAMILRY